nr:Uncharacterised protein [Raoultella sp. NCTC 9187]
MGLRPRWPGKGAKRGIWGEDQERNFAPCLRTRSQACVLTFSASGLLPRVLRFSCWPLLLFSKTLQTFKIAGVLFLFFRGAEAELIQHLVF